MNKLAIYALLAALAGWGLTAMTGMNLLSGPFAGRSCQTGCVQGYFFAALAVVLVGFVLALVSLRRPGGRALSVAALVACLPLCGLFAVLFYTGNFV